MNRMWPAMFPLPRSVSVYRLLDLFFIVNRFQKLGFSSRPPLPAAIGADDDDDDVEGDATDAAEAGATAS